MVYSSLPCFSKGLTQRLLRWIARVQSCIMRDNKDSSTMVNSFSLFDAKSCPSPEKCPSKKQISSLCIYIFDVWQQKDGGVAIFSNSKLQILAKCFSSRWKVCARFTKIYSDPFRDKSRCLPILMLIVVLLLNTCRASLMFLMRSLLGFPDVRYCLVALSKNKQSASSSDRARTSASSWSSHCHCTHIHKRRNDCQLNYVHT